MKFNLEKETMKMRFLKHPVYAAMLVVSLALTSCGDKNKQEDTDPDSVEVSGTVTGIEEEVDVDTAAVNPDTIMGP